MRFTKIFAAVLSLTVLIFTFVPVNIPVAQAAVGVSSTELQASVALLLPSGDRLELLDGYSPFSLDTRESISGGIRAHYQSRLLLDPRVESELPELQLLVFSYATQVDAIAAVSQLQKSLSDKTVLQSDSRNLFFRSDGGEDVDAFSTINAEYYSFHWVHSNGNLVYQASLYRTNGAFNEKNLKTYSSAISNLSKVKVVLSDLIETSKGMSGILFPPTDADNSLLTESDSVNLGDSVSVPSHGAVEFQVYINDPAGAVGTILDSSGADTADAGDIYLYLQKDGFLYAGLYAPVFDSDCPQEAGWYRLASTHSVSSYEWNDVRLHFGVGGFWLELNGVKEASCQVAQARSDNSLFLGDFPGDGINESMLGYIKGLVASASMTLNGQVWDTVLEQQLFLDLQNTDPDLPVFQYLKERGVFLGSDGMLNPDAVLNRAEMVKILLKAYGKTVSDGDLSFMDVGTDAWYHKYLFSAFQIGMILGHDDGSFLPAHSINRAEFFMMLSRLGKNKTGTEPFLDVTEEDWFEPAARYAYSKGLLGGLFFRPDILVTRREAARILYDLLK